MSILRKLKFLSPLVPYFVINSIKKGRDKKQLEEWHQKGCPVPPPHIVKQLAIRDYQQKSGYSTLVETGTFMGDMVQAQKKFFKKIISIELGTDLFKNAKNRFRNDNNVEIVNGDSSKMLPGIVQNIPDPAIFWLDGHYSHGVTAKGDTECPIFNELDAIFNKRFNHILLIDDARCFTGEGDYPKVEAITNYLVAKRLEFQHEVKDDIIRYVIQKCN